MPKHAALASSEISDSDSQIQLYLKLTATKAQNPESYVPFRSKSQRQAGIELINPLLVQVLRQQFV